ncbi:glycosyl hydrolase family 18 protein [Sulfoacidibacillus thermotolerans]|uniref:Uncharacterized protein n=1 Tax=Sulfoacidibacillus thermotolerans TaxID=1765684 RepID=A0A2U3DC99_SULT2|nr:glycosyl hydrolase family 18 protein [Sulfoacidibacillus thermotolerans]PWI58909.1 hypothetical protein BM613_02165 [Sulfoacidibacillus thermotolerans]
MYIYTVKKGDTTASIAKSHFIREYELRQINGLRGSKLTQGINLLIPGPPSTLIRHTVGAGESLFSIARRYNTSVTAVADANGLSDSAELQIGQILFVPAPLDDLREIEGNGYLIPSGTDADREIPNDLTYVTIFSYHVSTTGELTPVADTKALPAIQEQGLAPLLSVSNFDGSNFNTELAHTILSSPDLQAKVITNIEKVLQSKGYRGVNVDFEHMQPSDRSLYNEFIKNLTDRMHANGYLSTLALGPKTKDEPNAAWMGAFDYKTLGSLVDFIMLMTYEWGWVGGPPMAVAPLNQVQTVLDYAVSVIPREKILMGMPTYGYDWEISGGEKKLATGISPVDAQNLAIEKGVVVHFDPMAASPMFRYREGEQEHEVWYEDAKSVLAKFHLIYEMNLRGISLWVLGQPFPQLYELIPDTFKIRKV